MIVYEYLFGRICLLFYEFFIKKKKYLRKCYMYIVIIDCLKIDFQLNCINNDLFKLYIFKKYGGKNIELIKF